MVIVFAVMDYWVLKEHSPKIDGLTYHTFGQTIEDLAVMGTVLQVVQRTI